MENINELREKVLNSNELYEMGNLKIELDLTKCSNNYYWKNKEELNNYIKYMLLVLWDLQKELANAEEDRLNEEDRLYDILDMFTSYKIIEEKENENE